MEKTFILPANNLSALVRYNTATNWVFYRGARLLRTIALRDYYEPSRSAIATNNRAPRLLRTIALRDYYEQSRSAIAANC